MIRKGRNTKKTTEEFIEDARTIHKEKYDYSKVVYTNARDKVDIVCPLHGLFRQTPNQHLCGNGCKSCGDESRKKSRLKTQEQFLKDALKVHGVKYNYAKTNYVKDSKEITVICPRHGDFQQTPNSHLRGKGCPKCGKEKSERSRKTSKDSFIEKSIRLHGDKYLYHLLPEVLKVRDRVSIVCPIHGVYTQVAYYHLNGNGCPSCSASSGELFVENTLKEMGVEFISQYRLKEYDSKQSFDFFIPHSLTFIEYDGLHHFEPVRFSNSITEDEAVEKFYTQRLRDRAKEEWCKMNGYKIIRIPYYKNREDIKELLYNIFN